MKKIVAGVALCASLLVPSKVKDGTVDWNRPPSKTEPKPPETLFTVDDGPNEYMIDIAKTLDSAGHKSIFFVIGNQLNKKTKRSIAQLLCMGHKVGNHSYSHPHFRDISLAQAKEEVLKTDKLITSAMDCACPGTDQKEKYFRYPYGLSSGRADSLEFEKFLDSLGYGRPMKREMGPSIDSGIDLRDREGPPPQRKIDGMRPDNTILLHNKEWTINTIKRLDSVLNMYK